MEQIGRHVYNNLKNKKELTPEEEEAIKNYEAKKNEMTPEQREAIQAYNEIIKSTNIDKTIKLDKATLWKNFLEAFALYNERVFETTPEVLENIKPLFLYFMQDEDFFNCERLTRVTEPSFKKGLLIVGGYGNGKTAIMKALKVALNQTPFSFSLHNVNDVVTRYEECDENIDKQQFWRLMTAGRTCFDDVKTERIASNYGKANIIKDILEKRYSNGVITHMTCNYREGGTTDVKDAVNEFGEKYGGRVHDRVYEMFNVIEFKGKSLRK